MRTSEILRKGLQKIKETKLEYTKYVDNVFRELHIIIDQEKQKILKNVDDMLELSKVKMLSRSKSEMKNNFMIEPEIKKLNIDVRDIKTGIQKLSNKMWVNNDDEKELKMDNYFMNDDNKSDVDDDYPLYRPYECVIIEPLKKKILDIIYNGRADNIWNMVDFLESNYYPGFKDIGGDVCGLAMKICNQKKAYGITERIMNLLQNKYKCLINIKIFNSYINALVLQRNANKMRKASNEFIDIETKYGLKKDVITISILLKGFRFNDQLDGAYFLWNTMINEYKLRPHYVCYIEMIKIYWFNGFDGSAHDLYTEYQNKSDFPDYIHKWFK